MMKFLRKSKPEYGTGAYRLVVTFDREHSEDDEIAADANRTLAEQLRAELQEAYDCGHIAGHFQIVSVTKA